MWASVKPLLKNKVLHYQSSKHLSLRSLLTPCRHLLPLGNTWERWRKKNSFISLTVTPQNLPPQGSNSWISGGQSPRRSCIPVMLCYALIALEKGQYNMLRLSEDTRFLWRKGRAQVKQKRARTINQTPLNLDVQVHAWLEMDNSTIGLRNGWNNKMKKQNKQTKTPQSKTK